jgi:hypothetical protein
MKKKKFIESKLPMNTTVYHEHMDFDLPPPPLTLCRTKRQRCMECYATITSIDEHEIRDYRLCRGCTFISIYVYKLKRSAIRRRKKVNRMELSKYMDKDSLNIVMRYA